MIFGFLTKYRDYRARVHKGPGGDTSTSYIMNDIIKLQGPTPGAFHQGSHQTYD